MRNRSARLPVALAAAAALLTPAAAPAGNPIEDRLKEGVAVELVQKLAEVGAQPP